MKREIRIKPITNGTVIDHLNQGSIYKILEVLHLREYTVTAAMNVESRKLGKKDIIFIEGKVLDDEELNKIALIGKGASVNVVKNSEIKNIVEQRLNEFSDFKNKQGEEWFSEMCFCLLTANSSRESLTSCLALFFAICFAIPRVVLFGDILFFS